MKNGGKARYFPEGLRSPPEILAAVAPYPSYFIAATEGVISAEEYLWLENNPCASRVRLLKKLQNERG